MIYLFTGNGKGKTTAALGQAARAVGEGKRVLMVQFIKGPWKSGEDDIKIVPPGDKPEGKFQLVKMGKGFVGIMGDTLPREEHMRAAEQALAYAKKEAESGRWDIIILDEINNAVSLNLVSGKKVLDFLQATCLAGRQASYHLQAIVLTGRDAPKEFIEIADLVTEMKDMKHPYEKGAKAKRGLEY